MTTARHYTATGFVVHEGCVALHWHSKVRAWLPAGGHINDNEDPVQALLREVHEETGLEAKVVPTAQQIHLDYPAQVPSPFTILVEDIHDPADGYHQHIDLIYFCRVVGPPGPLKDGWQWVSRSDLANGTPMTGQCTPPTPPPDDVRLLAEEAFRAVGDLAG